MYFNQPVNWPHGLAGLYKSQKSPRSTPLTNFRRLVLKPSTPILLLLANTAYSRMFPTFCELTGWHWDRPNLQKTYDTYECHWLAATIVRDVEEKLETFKRALWGWTGRMKNCYERGHSFGEVIIGAASQAGPYLITLTLCPQISTTSQTWFLYHLVTFPNISPTGVNFGLTSPLF